MNYFELYLGVKLKIIFVKNIYHNYIWSVF